VLRSDQVNDLVGVLLPFTRDRTTEHYYLTWIFGIWIFLLLSLSLLRCRQAL